LLADKKTEEGWRGCLGTAPDEAERIDGAVEGYFDEPLRTPYMGFFFESLHDSRDFLCALSHDGGASFSEESRYRFFVRHIHVHALRNLSNDRGKQRSEFPTTEVGKTAEEFRRKMLIEEKLRMELMYSFRLQRKPNKNLY